MGFIDPRTDFGFKRIFGSPRSQPILRSFLNAIVYQGQPRIQSVEILDPFQQTILPDYKLTILDIKAQLDDGTIVIIEMQVAKVKAFLKRIFFNTTKAYSSQLSKGQTYLELKPIISVAITDFVLFEGRSQVISRHKILDAETHELSTEEFQWIFVELPKFAKELPELSDLADCWLYFLDRAWELEQIPTELDRDDDLRYALEIANESQLSPIELNALEAERDYIWVRQGEMMSAREDGIQQGVEQGLEQGERRAQFRIARELLKTMSPEAVSQATGLSLADIQKL